SIASPSWRARNPFVKAPNENTRSRAGGISAGSPTLSSSTKNPGVCTMRLCVPHGWRLRAPTLKPRRLYCSPAASRSCTAWATWSRPLGIAASRSHAASRRAASPTSLHRRETGRLEKLVGEGHHQRAVLLGLAALGNPFWVGREGGPLLLAIGHRFPGEQIHQVVVRLADLGGPEARLLDAVLLEQLERDG